MTLKCFMQSVWLLKLYIESFAAVAALSSDDIIIYIAYILIYINIYN